jgi:tripartite-type tricarboxylate transporter receptor subunit TctC
VRRGCDDARSMLSAAVLVAAAFVASASAAVAADGYPVRAVRFVVASSIGSGQDVAGRVIADALSQTLGQQFVVDNRAGAGTNIGIDIVAKAPADGYTLLFAAAGLAANVTLYRHLPFDPVRDFAPISRVASLPSAVCVNAAVPAKTLQELIQLAKVRAGELRYASGGAGTGSFLAAEFFKSVAGIDLLQVPYKGGGPALNGLLAGEAAVMVTPATACVPYVAQGRVRILAVTSAQRVPSMAEIPTAIEAGLPGYEFENWYGLLAPAGTPRAIIAKLHRAVIDVLHTPRIATRLNDLGYIVVGDRPEQFAAYIKSEITKLGKVIRDAGVTAN